MTSIYGGVASLQAVTIGGTDGQGRDVTNELSYLVLDTAKAMRTIEPSIALRVHEGTPDDLLSSAIDVISTGTGYPSLFNDDVIIPLLHKWGVPREDALKYAVSGCVYMEIPGKNISRRVIGYFVLAKCLWWALHQGVNLQTGEQWGAPTPDPATFTSWQDVLEAYLEQVKFFTTKLVQLENTCRELYAKYLPRPFYSAILEGCIEQGKERTRWVYPSMVHDMVVVIGTTNVADALTAIRKVVFEDRLVTLPELIAILDRNWAGREDIRQACLRAPKYGNDDDYADFIAREVHHRTEAVMETVKDRFGFSVRGDGSAVSATYGLGADTPATPDGRFDGDPFADSTLAPLPGMDKKGPTAVLNSCAKIDTLQTYNHLLNQKFLPECLTGDMKPVFHLDPAEHRRTTGVDNKLILDNLERAAKMTAIWLRVPLIAGFNDSEEHIERVALLGQRMGVAKVSLLPYHEGGKSKSEQIGRPYPYSEGRTPDREWVQHLKETVERRGVPAGIGS